MQVINSIKLYNLGPSGEEFGKKFKQGVWCRIGELKKVSSILDVVSMQICIYLEFIFKVTIFLHIQTVTYRNSGGTMEVTTANCRFCSREFVGKEQTVRGTLKNHERYCIRNPANGAKHTQADDGSGDTRQVNLLNNPLDQQGKCANPTTK